MNMPGAAAILMAAGASERMGAPKALLPWMGTSLVAYQVEQLLLAGVRLVVVVLGHDAERVRAAIPPESSAVRVEVNPNWQEGVCSSIRAGVNATPAWAEAFLINGVDQPRRAETLRALLAGHRSGRQAITVPAYGGRRGHPPVLSAALRSDLLSLDEERQGLREIMHRYAPVTSELPAGREVLLNMNTHEEYLQALRDWDAGA